MLCKIIYSKLHFILPNNLHGRDRCRRVLRSVFNYVELAFIKNIQFILYNVSSYYKICDELQLLIKTSLTTKYPHYPSIFLVKLMTKKALIFGSSKTQYTTHKVRYGRYSAAKKQQKTTTVTTTAQHAIDTSPFLSTHKQH